MLSGLVSMFAGMLYTPPKEKGVSEPSSDTQSLIGLYALIRNAESWDELIEGMKLRGYALFPSDDDIFGVNFTSRRMVMLSDSGHYLAFIIERLGLPPEHLQPPSIRK